jgi:zinc D-Ala-D-Ala dipeptidase
MNQRPGPPADDYFSLPIPPLDRRAATTRHYRHAEVDLDRPEANEPLVDVASLGIAAEPYYHRSDGLNPPYYRAIAASLGAVYCRRSVAQKLLAVNQALASSGVELFVWDGYRPLACQRDLWQFFLDKARAALPGGSDEALSEYAARYCSDPRGFRPDDSTTWPTHVTGGAVDLTLRRAGHGDHLFMGGTPDDPFPASHTAHFETMDEAAMSASDLDARRNRRLLYWTMLAFDFANYPFEWWHFDWGTQMWSLQRPSGRGAVAVYGPAPAVP